MRFVLGETDHRGTFSALTDWLLHFVVLPKLSLLFLCEGLLVARLTLKGKRVEWVLRMLLMENVILPVFPIWKIFSVSACSDYWFLFCISLFYKSFFWLNLEIFVSVITSSPCVHFMRIYDFRFLFQVECFSVFDHYSVSQLILKIFLVTRAHGLGVWVSNELICAPSFPSTLIACESGGVNSSPSVLLDALTPLVLSIPKVNIDVS